MRISDWSSDVCSSDLTVGAPSESCRMLTAYLPGATPSSCDSAEYPAFPAASESTDRATSARARPPSARSAYAFSVPSKTTATEEGDRLSGVTAHPATLPLPARVRLMVLAASLHIGRASCRERGCQYV